MLKIKKIKYLFFLIFFMPFVFHGCTSYSECGYKEILIHGGCDSSTLSGLMLFVLSLNVILASSTSYTATTFIYLTYLVSVLCFVYSFFIRNDNNRVILYFISVISVLLMWGCFVYEKMTNEEFENIVPYYGVVIYSIVIIGLYLIDSRKKLEI